MKLARRQFLRLTVGGAVLPAVARGANAQSYPTRPVRIVAGFPPGTATDIDARLIAQWLSGRLAQQVIVDNRPGAGSNIAAEEEVEFTPIPLSIGYIRDGNLRALAVTSTTRSDALPDVPAIAEFVPGYVANVWHGIGASRRVPTDIINKLNTEINAVLADATIKERFAQLGAEPMPMSPDEFGKFIAEEIEKWAKVVKFAGIRPG